MSNSFAVRNPLFDHAGDGQNAGLDRLEPMSRNIDAALDDQWEEILQAGQERDERRGICLRQSREDLRHLYWSIKTGIGGQDGNPAGSEPVEVQRKCQASPGGATRDIGRRYCESSVTALKLCSGIWPAPIRASCSKRSSTCGMRLRDMLPCAACSSCSWCSAFNRGRNSNTGSGAGATPPARDQCRA